MKSFPLARLCLIAVFLASTTFAAPEHKNLQVLDKNISKGELKKTMEGFAAQLGVKCTFCHLEEQHEKTTASRSRTPAK